MGAEENKAISRRYYELLDASKGDMLSFADELLEPGMLSHVPGSPTPNDLAAQTGMGGGFWGAFPDLRHSIDEMVAEGDKVAVRLTLSGTQTGEFMGIPASGKEMVLTAQSILRIADGKVAEQWLEFDSGSMMQQIGAGPE